MEKALLFKNFSLRIPELLDRFIIENLTIDFLYNTCYIISGKSGCGKTTLFETVFNNHYSEFYKINTDNVGLITQENQLISLCTVKENIFIKSSLQKLDESYVHRFTEEFEKTIPIKDLLKKFPYQLSGGEKKIVHIFLSLLKKNQLLLVDEPFIHCDQFLGKTIFNLLLSQLKDCCLIIITHDFSIFDQKKVHFILENSAIKIFQYFN